MKYESSQWSKYGPTAYMHHSCNSGKTLIRTTPIYYWMRDKNQRKLFVLNS